jgi:outer membrane protein TolC
VGIATSALYPNFFLTGDFGYAGVGGDYFDNNNETWSIGPVFSWNLFDGGRVRNSIGVEEARTEQHREFTRRLRGGAAPPAGAGPVGRRGGGFG